VTVAARRGRAPGLTAAGRRWAVDVVAVLPAWVAARLIVGLAFVVTDAVIDHHGLAPRPAPRAQGLLAWDGVFYEGIAEVGYGGLPGEPLRFFPLFPWFGRVLSPAVGGDDGLALVVVANVAALIAAAVLRRLVIEERRDERLADRAAAFLLLVPPAFALVFAYSEALFLVFTIGCFLALHRRHWASVAAAAYLAALTRPVGVLLVVPIAVELWQHRATLRSRRGPIAGLALVAPVLGLGTFLVYTKVRFDTWTHALSVQRSFRGDTVDPISRLARGIGDLVGEETFGDGLHVPFALIGIALVVLGARRWPLRYTAFASAMVVLSLSADNLNSLERYLLGAFPLVMTLADLAASPRAERVTLAVCGGGLLSLTSLALLGEYVP
jgi:hypothetical protein